MIIGKVYRRTLDRQGNAVIKVSRGQTLSSCCLSWMLKFQAGGSRLIGTRWGVLRPEVHGLRLGLLGSPSPDAELMGQVVWSVCLVLLEAEWRTFFNFWVRIFFFLFFPSLFGSFLLSNIFQRFFLSLCQSVCLSYLSYILSTLLISSFIYLKLS